MRKGLKIAGYTLGGIVGVMLLVMVVVLVFGSPIARKVVEKHSPQWVGRQITLDHARINLFAGSVNLEGVHMLEEDNASDFAHFDSLYAQINLFKLLKKEVYLRHIWLTGFDAQVINEGKRFNFQDIIDHFSSDSTATEEPEDTTSSSWGIGLYDIRIRRSSVAYRDRSRRASWGMENINIDVPGVYFGKDKTEAGLSLDFPNNQGSVELQGHYDMERESFALDMDLDSVHADMAMPFVRDYLNVSQLGTRISGCVRAYGNLSDLGAVCLAGDLSLDGTDVRNTEGNSLATLQHLGVVIDTIDMGQLDFRIRQVELSSLNTTFERWEHHNTFSSLMVNQPADTTSSDDIAETDSVQQTKPLRLLVKNVAIDGVNVRYVDHTLHKPFSYAATLGVHAQNLTLQGENNVQMAAQLPHGGSINASWKGGLNLKTDNEVLSLTAKNIQMKDFSPWVEYYTASPLEDGKLSITSENRINTGQLRGTNVIDIYGLVAGQKLDMDAEYKAVPVKLAVGLLEDLNHKINLSVPISGDLNSPKFSYSKIIWKTIGNILLKATASPWVALGKALGIGGDNLSQLEIDPLQPDFTSEQYATLDKLVQMVKAEEEVMLCMTQTFSMKDAIAERGVFNLKKAYYQHLHGASQTISLADIEEIRAIKDKDAGLLEYTTQLTGHEGTIQEQAAAYYSTDSLQEEVMQMATIRNKTLEKYLIQQQGLPKSRVRIKTQTPEQLRASSGKSRYDVSSSDVTL